MRTYGRVTDARGNRRWVVVETDADGFNDYVWLTTLVQVLRLIRGESPFWSNYGIPAQQAVVQQVFPDFYVALTQQQFAQYFAALTVARLPSATPTYQVNVTLQKGVKVQENLLALPATFILDQSLLGGGDVLG